MAKKPATGPVRAAGPTAATSAATTAAASAAPAKVVSREIPAKPAKSAEAERPEAHADAISPEMIAFRAYFLFQNGTPGSQDDHWRQAEWELNNK